jgi:hypothetical protein
MNFELYKQASALAANVGGFWQARSWLDQKRDVYIMESPDIPGCRVEVAAYAEDDERYEHKELERLHFEKRVEILYDLLEKGLPLPEYADTCHCDEMKERAKAQSPFYFVIKVEWREDDDWTTSDGKGQWVASTQVQSELGDYVAYDAEDEIGRVLAMIGDHLWAYIDGLMEDGYWPPERAKHGEWRMKVLDGAEGKPYVLTGFFDASVVNDNGD